MACGGVSQPLWVEWGEVGEAPGLAIFASGMERATAGEMDGGRDIADQRDRALRTLRIGDGHSLQ